MSTRDRILDAAYEVMRTAGLARATTKEIARAAGFSEATLYKHFVDKTDLFVHVLAERLPAFLPVVDELSAAPERSGVGDNLRRIARAALDFYAESFPIAASVFSEPRVMAAHREGLRRTGAGPAGPNRAVTAYLTVERDRGRIAADADLDAAASLLLGACLQHAFLSHFGADGRSSDEVAAALATTLARALAPGAG